MSRGSQTYLRAAFDLFGCGAYVGLGANVCGCRGEFKVVS